uniref:Reverse transcriptase domain-containing protein n=1 Tax=Ananas comosus var. bracteatus TaxID=296719 RepID=A0A6V7NPX4_ANACO|nr:unnamed protein product [Ananas comosus var. bracteatus]
MEPGPSADRPQTANAFLPCRPPRQGNPPSLLGFSRIGHRTQPLRFEGSLFHFSNWKEVGELERGHLHHKAWIRLLHWPILCWNEEDVKAAVSGFGELWEVDPLSERRDDVSFFRARIRCQSVHRIPEILTLMVEDKRFQIPVVIESWEDANPILLGEGLDEHLGIETMDAQEAFIRQTGFQSIPSSRPRERPRRDSATLCRETTPACGDAGDARNDQHVSSVAPSPPAALPVADSRLGGSRDLRDKPSATSVIHYSSSLGRTLGRPTDPCDGPIGEATPAGHTKALEHVSDPPHSGLLNASVIRSSSSPLGLPLIEPTASSCAAPNVLCLPWVSDIPCALQVVAPEPTVTMVTGFSLLRCYWDEGGLLTAWNPSLFECVEEWSHSFALTLALRRRSDGRRFLISNVYGPTCASSRLEFFQHLNYLGHLSRGAWVVMGDFNILLFAFDKNGPFSTTNDTFLFRELVRDLSLYDVPLLHKSYTWTNGRRNPTLERLDRVFILQDWTVSFPRNCLRALPRPRFDHAPLVLTAHTFLPKADLFRFESFWLRYPNIADVIAQAWNSTVPSLDPVQRFDYRIKQVQLALCSWSAGIISSIKKQAACCLSWLDWLDRAEERRSLTHHECLLRPLLKCRYEELCLQEEIKWKQRSRIHWLKVGDANTNSLGVSQATTPIVNLSSLYCADNADLSSLSAPFTIDEVKLAIFSCAPEKAPGPDGLSMIFYQRFWNVLKSDIMELFDSFYNGTSDFSILNCNWICPIPKKNPTLSARDLRPISLVHSLPKLISKVLAARLQLLMNNLINPFQGAFIKGRYILDNFLTAHILCHHLHSSKQQAALFKIDFDRAFDHINWSFLTELLRVRGFGKRWIRWITSLL